MGLWDSIKARLGLADEYDEYGDEYYDDDEGYEPAERFKEDYGTVMHANDDAGVRRVDRRMEADRARETAPVRRIAPEPAVSALPQVKMQILEPKSFSEAQTIADKFKQGMPIIINLTMTPPDLAKRFVDFASGLTYGLNGGLQKVNEDRRRLRETGLYDFDV